MEQQTHKYMVKDGKQVQKNRLLKVTPDEFNVENLNVPKEVESNSNPKGKTGDKKSFQYTLFPKYTFGQSTGENNGKVEPEEDTLCILTDPIKLDRGGLVRVDGDFRKSDDDCTSFWVPLDEKFGGPGAVSLRKAFEQIDKEWQKRLKKDYFTKGGKACLGPLKYIPLVRKATAPDDVENFEEWNRTKVRIPSTDNEVEGTVHKKLNVKLALPNGEGGHEKKLVHSVTELREDFTYGSTVQLCLELKTFWILRNAKNGERECGFKVTCNLINVLEKASRSGKRDFDWDDVLTTTGKSESKSKPESQPVKVDKSKNESKSESESSSDSDEDSPPPKKEVSKKPAKKAEPESESSSDSDSDDPEPPKKEVKKNSKQVKKSNK